MIDIVLLCLLLTNILFVIFFVHNSVTLTKSSKDYFLNLFEFDNAIVAVVLRSRSGGNVILVRAYRKAENACTVNSTIHFCLLSPYPML